MFRAWKAKKIVILKKVSRHNKMNYNSLKSHYRQKKYLRNGGFVKYRLSLYQSILNQGTKFRKV